MREDLSKHCSKRTGRLEDASLERRFDPSSLRTAKGHSWMPWEPAGAGLCYFASYESSAGLSSAQGEEWGSRHG